jgi:hypothetical protein
MGPFTGSYLTGILAQSDVTTVIMVGAALTTSADNTVFVPSTKTLAVIGNLSLGTGDYTINAFYGKLDLSSGRLTGGDSSDKLMLNAQDKADADEADAIDPGPEFVGLVASISPTGTDTADGSVMMETLTIGTGSNAVTAARLLQYLGGERIYINGNLTTNEANPFGAAKVTVFGSTTASDNITLTDPATGTNLQGPLVAGDDITVSGLNHFAAGTLNTSTYEVTVDPTGLSGALALATLNSADSNGKLKLTDAITSVTIGNGTGNIEYDGAAVTLTTSSFGNEGQTTFKKGVTVTTNAASFAGPVDFLETFELATVGATFGGDAGFTGAVTTSTGLVTFNGAAVFGAGALTTGGAVTFNETASFGAGGITDTGGVTTFAKAATFTGPVATGAYLTTFSMTAEFEGTADFGGNATFAGATFGGDVSTGGVTIFNGTASFNDASLDLSLGGTTTFKENVTFTAGEAIKTGITTSTITLETGKKLAIGEDDVITAGGSNVVLTPSAADVTLTFAANKITQDDGDIKINGEAALADSASYEVSADNDLEIDTGASLTLLGTDAAGAKLILANSDGSDGSILKGAGSLIADATTIVGGTNGWEAGNDDTDPITITISPNTISGSSNKAVFAAVTGAADAVITVAADGTLNIAVNTIIDLLGSTAKVGSIVLEMPNAPKAGAILSFAKGTTSIVKTGNTTDGGSAGGLEYASVGTGLAPSTDGSEYLISFTSMNNEDPHTIQANDTTNAEISGATVLQ